MPLSLFRKPWSFQRYQIALVMLSVLPVMLVFGFVSYWKGQEVRDSVNQGMLRTAEALSLAVDREVGTVLASLEALADSEAVDREDIAGFAREALRAAEKRRDSWIVLTERSGQQLVNTSLPAGEPLPLRTEINANPGMAANPGESNVPVGLASDVQKVFATGQPAFSNLFMSIAHKRPVVAILFPVKRQGEVRYVLNMTFPPQGLTDLVGAQVHGPEQLITIIDGNSFILARSEQPEFAGTKVPASYALPPPGGSAHGVISATSLTGQPVYRAFTRSPLTGWTVSIATPKQEADWQVAAGVLRTIVFGVAGLLLSILLALWSAERLRSPISVLTAKAAGESTTPMPRSFVASEFVALERTIDEGNRAREAEMMERDARVAAEARKREADAANQAKDRFLAMLAHELRNPLAAISNAVSLMEMAPHESNSMTPILKRQTGQLKKMVDDLLDVARVTSGKIRLMLERVELLDLATNCVDTFVRTGRSADHDLSIEGQRVMVYADRHRMTQVLTNLLDNAVKFSPSGASIKVAVGTEGDEAVVKVIDTGAGISADVLARIFDVFVQGDQPLERGHGGLGLGLALAKSLIEAQRGRITAESEGPGKGAVFTIRMTQASGLDTDALRQAM